MKGSFLMLGAACGVLCENLARLPDTLVCGAEHDGEQAQMAKWRGKGMLNNTQIKQLFEREAMLIGTADGMPVYQAAEVFGRRAAQFRHHFKA